MPGSPDGGSFSAGGDLRGPARVLAHELQKPHLQLCLLYDAERSTQVSEVVSGFLNDLTPASALGRYGDILQEVTPRLFETLLLTATEVIMAYSPPVANNEIYDVIIHDSVFAMLSGSKRKLVKHDLEKSLAEAKPRYVTQRIHRVLYGKDPRHLAKTAINVVKEIRSGHPEADIHLTVYWNGNEICGRYGFVAPNHWPCTPAEPNSYPDHISDSMRRLNWIKSQCIDLAVDHFLLICGTPAWFYDINPIYDTFFNDLRQRLKKEDKYGAVWEGMNCRIISGERFADKVAMKDSYHMSYSDENAVRVNTYITSIHHMMHVDTLCRGLYGETRRARARAQLEYNLHRDPNFAPATSVALHEKYREQKEAIRKVVESIKTTKFTKKQALARPPHLDITEEEMNELLRAVEGEVKRVTAPVLGDSGDELETEERKEAAKGASRSSVAGGSTEPPAASSERPKKVHRALREDYRKTEALPDHVSEYFYTKGHDVTLRQGWDYVNDRSEVWRYDGLREVKTMIAGLLRGHYVDQRWIFKYPNQWVDLEDLAIACRKVLPRSRIGSTLYVKDFLKLAMSDNKGRFDFLGVAGVDECRRDGVNIGPFKMRAVQGHSMAAIKGNDELYSSAVLVMLNEVAADPNEIAAATGTSPSSNPSRRCRTSSITARPQKRGKAF